MHGFDQDDMPYASAPTWSVDNEGLISSDGKFTTTVAGVYNITATSNGLTASITIEVLGTDVNELEASMLKIYNTNTTLHVTNLNVADFGEVKVYNSIGTLIKKVDVNAETIEISTTAMQPGVYIVSVIGNRIINKRIIIK